MNLVNRLKHLWLDEKGQLVIPGQSSIQASQILNPSELGIVWTDVAFDAGDFDGSDSQTWTVEDAELQCFKYTIIGKLMILALSVSNSDIGGTPALGLEVLIPDGFTSNGNQNKVSGFGIDAGTITTINAFPDAGTGGLVINVFREDFANWSASTANCTVQFTIAIQID